MMGTQENAKRDAGQIAQFKMISKIEMLISFDFFLTEWLQGGRLVVRFHR